jgi:hypothetical protein
MPVVAIIIAALAIAASQNNTDTAAAGPRTFASTAPVVQAAPAVPAAPTVTAPRTHRVYTLDTTSSNFWTWGEPAGKY